MYLLDTHILLWFLDRNTKLDKKYQQLITDNLFESKIHISVISLLEITIKHKSNKLKLPVQLEVFLEFVKSNYEIINIETNHLVAFHKIEFQHQDPFDRLLISQAVAEDMYLISQDKMVLKHDFLRKID